MKTRNGFVSNSSSSSFIIYGICEYDSDILKKLSKSPEVIQKLKDEDVIWDKERECFMSDGEEIESYEIFEMLFYNTGSKLENHCPYEDDVFIGVSLLDIGGDETMNQFKERAKQELAKFNLDKFPMSIHEECWRDG